MSTSKVTGVIDGISDYKSKDFFNIALEDSEQDDNWYIGDGTLRDYGQFDKGDKVRLTVDDNKGSVTNVEPVGKPQRNDVMESGASEDGGSRDGGDADSSVGGSTGSNQSYTSKDDRINKKVAFKEAAETVRRKEEDGYYNGDLSEGEHQQKVSDVATGYYNILKSMGENQ